ncbi:unnamed protein product [Polarella glacialis]|uniref:Uncharacterized protein n=1 Tax=Polarella glacialis TaxID=89957 RepID=A0A813DQ08_POLGL|nr:unnamed protein product [Polarella glacialis]
MNLSELSKEDQARYESIAQKQPGEIIEISKFEPGQGGTGGAKKTMAEWASTEGVMGCAYMLVTFKDIKDNDGLNVLWRLESALVVMDQEADNTTKTGAPFVKVSVSDMTGQIEARAGADVLCALAQLPFTPERLKELDGRIEDGSLTFITSTVYVQREVRADKSNPEILYINYTIRAAYPDLFASTALRFETGLKPTVLPALLSKIKPQCLVR